MGHIWWGPLREWSRGKKHVEQSEGIYTCVYCCCFCMGIRYGYRVFEGVGILRELCPMHCANGWPHPFLASHMMNEHCQGKLMVHSPELVLIIARLPDVFASSYIQKHHKVWLESSIPFCSEICTRARTAVVQGGDYHLDSVLAWSWPLTWPVHTCRGKLMKLSLWKYQAFNTGFHETHNVIQGIEQSVAQAKVHLY